MSVLLKAYKSLPKDLKMQKHTLGFFLSEKMYQDEKKLIFDNKFLGMDIIVQKERDEEKSLSRKFYTWIFKE